MKERDEGPNSSEEPFIAPSNPDEIITTSNSESQNQRKELSESEQQDQDKIQMELREFKVEFTSVKEVLKSTNVDTRDNYDLIKFTIKAFAVYEYNWIVYRRPADIKKNFAEILSSQEKNFMNPPQDIKDIFTHMSEMQEESMRIHVGEIEDYYKALFNNPQIKNNIHLKEFFNISLGSFNQNNGGVKPFEGYVYKKADPHCLRTAFSYACKCIEYFAFSQYNLRWIVVKEDCIYYLDKSNSEVGKNVYFFDNDIKVTKDGKDIINVTNVSRTIILKFKTFFERELWYEEITRRVDIMKKVIQGNIYKSYTNEKRGNIARWFSDGEAYYKDLKEKLMNAKESIFITDWWMSPEVWLERPVNTQEYISLDYHKKKLKDTPPYSRLMDILFQCANRGVKVYVLVYAECSLALTLNSAHTQRALENHPNIQVERHPLNCTDLLWSHHEKLVIIDQTIGYVGGLDLCWGRFDTNDHPIWEEKNSEEKYLFPCIDYSNARICDFDNVDKYLEESVERKDTCRMPWHDVHSRVSGPVVADIARHFVERWNFARFGTGSGITDIKTNASVSGKSKQEEGGQSTAPTGLPKGGFMAGIINQVNEENKKKEEEEGLQPIEEEEGTTESKETGETEEKKPGLKGPTKLRPGKSKLRAGKPKKKDITQKIGYQEEKEMRDRYFQDMIVEDEDHLYKPKNPTAPIRLRGRGGINKRIKNIRKAKEEEDKKAAESQEGMKEKDSDVINTNLKADDSKNKEDTYTSFVKKVGESSKKNKESWFGKIFTRAANEDLLETNVKINFFERGVKSSVQVLRSGCKWSCGIGKTENSILQAYYRLIDNSEHYLYIENQFFVSRAFNDEEREQCDHALSDVVNNLIAYHIRKRIETAYIKKEKFRVFVFIPLLPGFAGEPEESGTLQIILKHTYAGINRNFGCSIIEELEKIMGDEWKKYIGFYSLRGHGMVNGVPTTELIYIHSKLMIVDDKIVLLGSANINDRSMLGTRDSEYAIIIKENPTLKIRMDGKDGYDVAKFAATFRRALMAEHLGLKPNDEILVDPLSDQFLELVQSRARTNTETYRKIWGCYPDDNYRSFQDLKNNYKMTRTTEEIEELKKVYNEEKNKIVGHAVEFPLHFLEDAKLGISFFSAENIVPERNFT